MNEHYQYRAKYWDCFFGDRKEEIRFWLDQAGQYGPRVLVAMCATGEVAMGMAKSNFHVYAVDLVFEMVQIGRGRSSPISPISYIQGDVKALPFPAGSIDFAFLGTGDFHHFLTPGEQKVVLDSLWRCLRPGGGLGLDLFPPPRGTERRSSGRKTFTPMRPPFEEEVQLRKESETLFNPQDLSLSISQTMFVLENHYQREFSYNFVLQLFKRQALRTLLRESGFKVSAEYGSYQKELYDTSASKWIVIASKFI